MRKFLAVLLAVFVAAALLTLVCGYWYLNPGRGPREQIDPDANAYVEQHAGTTVLHLKGSPYEMGYQHGALLKDGVQASIARFEELLGEMARESGQPRFAVEGVLDVVYRWCEPHFPERFKREMEGLADGAEVSLKTVRRFHVVDVVTERACSVFAVFGGATKDGIVYHGRNFDWIMDAGIQDAPILILYEPEGLERFASAGYVGMVGVLSGMNMDGIAVGQIGAISNDSRWSGIPLMLLQRRILEEARDVKQAAAIFQGVRRTVGYNFVVADGDAGEARAFETCANHCVEFTDDDPKETVEYAIRIDDAVFRADEAMDQTVRASQRCANAPALPYGSNSYDHRYKGMATRIQEHWGDIDQAIALDILRGVAMRKVNLHSVLCDCTNRRMWVAHAKATEDAWKQDYVEYDLNMLFTKPAQRVCARASERP